MNVSEYVEKLEANGASFSMKGERMMFTPPPNMPRAQYAEALSFLKENRIQVVELLTKRRLAQREPIAECGSPNCNGCYEAGEGKKIHPPRPDDLFFEKRLKYLKPEKLKFK